MSSHEPQPLPEALLVAADLRRQAKVLELMAQRLEASCPQPDNNTETVEFLFDPRVNRKEKERSNVQGKRGR